MNKAIDVSHHNNVQHFNSDEYSTIIIRSRSGKSEDKKVGKHVNLAKASGKPYGLYIYSYACNEQGAIKEAVLFIKDIEKYKPSFIAFDMEDADYYKLRHNALDEKNILSVTMTFFQTLLDAGINIPLFLYASDSWFRKYFDNVNWKCFAELHCIKNWVARWNVSPPITNYDMWQYTSYGIVNGIKGRVDISNVKEEMFHVKHENTQNNINVGDRVMLKTRYDINGTRLASFTLLNIYEVQKIQGKRIVIGKKGRVTCATVESNLVKI